MRQNQSFIYGNSPLTLFSYIYDHKKVSAGGFENLYATEV